MNPVGVALVYQIGRSLEQLRQRHDFVERIGTVSYVEGSLQSIEVRPSRTPLDLNDNERSGLIGLLLQIQEYCNGFSLRTAVHAAEEFVDGLKSERIKTNGHATQEIVALDKIIGIELREKLFLQVPTERAAFYANPELFGEEVNKKFPSCQYDIEEAGNCYAAGRGTASAFHLMRIMESGLQQLGTALGVKFADEKNWQNVLDQVNKAIRIMPPKEDRTIALSAMAGHLYNVKLAWRNPTMHPKGVYTVEEAGDLMNAVKVFIVDLAHVI